MRLIVLAAILVTVHTLTNSQYGFHRDDRATIDDAPIWLGVMSHSRR
jgi:hypothetical protein